MSDIPVLSGLARWLRESSLSARIMTGLVAGLLTGLVIGERAAALQIVADAFVKLLQMTVLPYVVVSLISGLGALNFTQAKLLGLRVGAVLVTLWAIALCGVLLFPLMFPQMETASFFSTTLLETPEPFDLVGLYIPSNPFNSLANNVVPAVVVFSVVLGIALIGVPHKQPLLDVLAVVSAAVSRATNFIVSLTPYGIFAIAAVTSGTLDLVALQRIQVYLLSYIAVSLLLSLWILPGLVAAVTPVPYRALLSVTRDALIMAFMTGSLFVVLPMLTEHTKLLLRRHASSDATAETTPDIIVPASFNFPHTGKLLSLSFVVFAGWFADAALTATDYPRLASTGLLVLFGSMNVAIPFLLDMFHIPADTFQLFLATSVVNARFGTLMSAVHTLTVGVLGTCAVIGCVTFDRRRLLRFGIVTMVVTGATVGGTRVLLSTVLAHKSDTGEVLRRMQPLRDRGQARVYRSGEAVPPLPPVTTSVLARIRERGAIRVGYMADSLPYAFVNEQGTLVGLDVEMAHQLARDSGVALELVPVDRASLATGLSSSTCDLVMSGAALTAERAMHVLHSASYLDETMAFMVLDQDRAAFTRWDDVRARTTLRVGVPDVPYYVAKVRAELPSATLVPIAILDDVFKPRTPPLDATVVTAERGSAYTLLHPEYSVVVPQPRPHKVPLAYLIADHDELLATMVNAWIDLKRKDGTIDELFAHWVLGREAHVKGRRWSLLDELLSWKGQPAGVDSMAK